MEARNNQVQEDIQDMTYRKKKVLIWLFITLLWMAFIFYKSSQPYTVQDIRPSLANWIPQWLADGLPIMEFHYNGQLITSALPYDFIEFFIRKAAHVGAFAGLAWLAIHTLRMMEWRRTTAVVIGALFTLLYAISDEWHQTFVAGRTGHAIDVGVDSIGIALVIIGYLIAGIISSRKRRRSPYRFK